MLKILIPTISLIPIVWLSTPAWLWPTALAHSFVIAFITLPWAFYTAGLGFKCLGPMLSLDPLSSPLVVLTCWLLPLMILASQKSMTDEPHERKRNYLTLLVLLQLFLILAFSAAEVILFYLTFEATLIPTLIIITRWGNQAERLLAGLYFLFYTLGGSLPLIVSLLLLEAHVGSLSLYTIQDHGTTPVLQVSNAVWWAGCFIAFLIKMPLYGLHLWLPKAHVEAPIAGSIVLAGVLLKLGGYGMMRMSACLHTLTKEYSYPFIILALWGLIMTGLICLRQTDLKSLIAYSSVGHMGLVVAGILLQTPWGFSGALILMIAHGLTSSALFCLANTNYERTSTRTMVMARGMQMIFPLMGLWWFLASLANLALPPLPNLMAELMVITSLIAWSWWTIALTGAAVMITAAYSLFLFLMTQRGPTPQHLIIPDATHTREHLMMALHLLPLLALILCPELIWGWAY